MEIAIPILALGSLFVMSNQGNNDDDDNNLVGEGSGSSLSGSPYISESFTLAGQSNQIPSHSRPTNNPNPDLPNINLIDPNYPEQNESMIQSGPFQVNKFNAPNQYQDRYFQKPDINELAKISEQTGAIPTQSNAQVFYSLTGKQIDINDFKHKNMVPYFGGKIRGSTTEQDIPENLLDNYVGNGSQYLSKQEMAPLFRPDEHVQWAHGMPSITSFEHDRMMTGVVGNKMSNVKPWEEIREAPGSLGFNSGQEYRDVWRDKTVDELRVATNPKTSYSLQGYEGPIRTIQTNRGLHAEVNKNLPDRHYELTPDRWMTTVGQEMKAGIIGEQPYRNQNRSTTSTEYEGIAGRTDREGTYVVGEYMEPHRKPSGTPNLPAAAGPGRKVTDYGLEGTNAYNNNRADNDQPDAFGIIGGAIGAVVAPLMDILRPSRKENAVGNLRIYDNVSGPKQTYTFNPADRPQTTIKETTEGSIYHWNAQGQTYGAYDVVNPVLNNTNRQETNAVGYGGIMGGTSSVHAQSSFEAGYNQLNNPYKEATAMNNRNPNGNTNVFNNHINQTTAKLEADRDNQRLWCNMRAPNAATPGIQQFGANSNGVNAGGVALNGQSGIMMDRNDAAILEAFKKNPFIASGSGGGGIGSYTAI